MSHMRLSRSHNNHLPFRNLSLSKPACCTSLSTGIHGFISPMKEAPEGTGCPSDHGHATSLRGGLSRQTPRKLVDRTKTERRARSSGLALYGRSVDVGLGDLHSLRSLTAPRISCRREAASAAPKRLAFRHDINPGTGVMVVAEAGQRLRCGDGHPSPYPARETDNPPFRTCG